MNMITKYRRFSAPALAAAVGLLLFVSPSASAVVLHDQTDHVDPSRHIVSKDLQIPYDSTAWDSFDSTAADDFTVPAGETWTIDGVGVLGYVAPDPEVSVSFPNSRVTLYRASGALPAVSIFTTIASPADGGVSPNFALPISGAPALVPGHYWVSVQAITGHQGWSWRQRTVVSGDPYVWENPGDAYDTGCTTFAPSADCDISPAADLAFKLSGTAQDTSAPKTKITKHPKNEVLAKTAKTNVKFAFKSSEGGSSFECKKDSEGWKDCSSPTKMKGLDEGKHKFLVRATDRAGNTDPTPAKDTFNVVG